MSVERYAVWVRFDTASEGLIFSVIDDLAKELSTPRFLPHLTLESGFASPAHARLRADEVVQRSFFASLELGNVYQGDDFFLAAFLKLAPSSEARFLSCTAATPSRREFKARPPHVSLVYASPSEHVLAEAKRRAEPLVGLRIDCRCFEIWQVGGRVGKWRPMGDPIELSPWPD